MLHYTGHFNKLSDITISKSGKYDNYIKFNCALRYESCIPLIMDLYTNKVQPFDIEHYNVIDPYLQMLHIAIQAKEYVKFECGVTFNTDKRCSINYPDTNDQYFDEHPPSIFYNSVITFNDEALRIYGLDIQLLPERKIIMRELKSRPIEHTEGILKVGIFHPSGTPYYGNFIMTIDKTRNDMFAYTHGDARSKLSSWKIQSFTWEDNHE